jgi:predicted ribosome quality control (RQC) complex YloA/Tae2 family protein
MKEIIINNKTIYYGENAKENTDLVKQFQEDNVKGFWYHLNDLPSPHCFYLENINLSKNELIELGNFLLEKIKNKIPKNFKEFYLDYTEISNVVTTKTHGLVFLKSSKQIRIK